MTRGGPGIASEVPAKFVMDHLFERNNIGLATAAATMMLVTVLCAARALALRAATSAPQRAARVMRPAGRAAADGPQRRGRTLTAGARRRLRLPGHRGAVLPAAAVDHGRHLAQAHGRGPPGQHPGLAVGAHAAALDRRPGPRPAPGSTATASASASGTRCGSSFPSVILSIAAGCGQRLRAVVLAACAAPTAVRHPAGRRLHALPDLPLSRWCALFSQAGHLQLARLHRAGPRHLRPAGDDAAVPQLLRLAAGRAVQGGAHRRRRLLDDLRAA